MISTYSLWLTLRPIPSMLNLNDFPDDKIGSSLDLSTLANSPSYVLASDITSIISLIRIDLAVIYFATYSFGRLAYAIGCLLIVI